MKQIIIDLLAKELKLDKREIENLIEIPPSPDLGDCAFPCFHLASKFKKSPVEIAKELSLKLNKKLPKEISEIKVVGPYINFFVNNKLLAKEVLKKILKKKKKYGRSNEGMKKKIVIDMSSPNIAKPFGIGHLRSTIIGNSIALIYDFTGYKPIKINYLGDWGTQFGRLIVGYKIFGNKKKLKKDPIRHMLKIYVKANSEKYEQEARRWFKKLEDGDKEALRLWRIFKKMSLKDFNKIYKTLGIKFNVISGESLYNKKMDKTIELLKEKKLLEESEGALIINLNKYGLGAYLIQKSDGATLYATRDITTAIERYKKYKFEKMFYEVGSEQKLHFKQLFKVLELMGCKWAKNCAHITHGLYLDKDGKKFSTRKGKTVFMQEILNETIELAKKMIEEKNPKLKNKEEVARKVAIGAIFYEDLKNFREHDIVFDINKFLSFEGNTGPYLQYSYARASSILKKAKSKPKVEIEMETKKSEVKLIKKLSQFPETIKKGREQLNPSIIANYAFELAQIFNEFYHECPVIGSKNESFRLALVEAFRIVIKQALYLLGIEVLEEM